MPSLATALREVLGRLLDPLAAAGGSAEGCLQLLQLVGHTGAAAGQPGLRAAVDDVATLADELAALGEDELRSWTGLARVLQASADAMDALRALEASVEDPAFEARLEGLGTELAEQLVGVWLHRFHPRLLWAAALLTLVEPAELADIVPPVVEDGTQTRTAWSRDALHLDRVDALVHDPWATLAAAYLPNDLASAADAHACAARLFPLLGGVLERLDLTWDTDLRSLEPEPPHDPDEVILGDHFDAEEQPANNEPPGGLTAYYASVLPRLVVVIARRDADGSPTGALLAAVLLASSAQHPSGVAGLISTLVGELAWTQTRGDWRLALAADGQVPVFVAGPGGLQLPASDTPGLGATLRFSADRIAAAAGEPVLVLGSDVDTRIELGQLGVEAVLSLRPDASSAAISATTTSSALIVTPGDGDGFLQKVLPEDGLRTGFDLGVGLSTTHGFFVHGAAGLDATLPAVAELLDVLRVEAVHVALRADDAGLAGELSATVSALLGPVTVTVERLGLELHVGFPQQGGNVGPAELAVGFKPPGGAALVVKSKLVNGGGYLFFDPAAGQYAGAVQLQLGDRITVAAIGLLSTRLPGGAPGFSLLLLITEQGFAPIPLGFGFTLVEIGGLVGVNRTVDGEALAAAVRSGGGPLLLPDDPVENAPAVVSALNTVMPPAPGRFLLGPLGMLIWGTEELTLMTVKLALIVELPQPVRLAVLARISVLLPEEEHPLVRLQLDALGRIDFEQGDLAVDAALSDSRILDWALTGTGALRASWGARPGLVVAAGGFHPRFPVPAGFPALERLTISLADSASLKLRLAAYLALTSNSLQFGGRLDLAASAGGFSIEGMLSIDTLIQRKPFAFAADLAASLALRHGGTVLLSVALTGSISGPAPWHVNGRARFSILFLDAEVAFDHTFGPAVDLPLPEPVDVEAILRAELTAAGNWSSELPAGTPPLVSLRDAPGDGVLAHPLGVVTLRQRRVPLDRTIRQLGTSLPLGGPAAYHVDVTNAAGAALPPLAAVEDLFARSEFEPMSDAERLGAPSFEPMRAGLRLGADAIEHPAALVLDIPVEYETRTFDPVLGRAA
jgi:Family of unknown function (DUF6603)